MVLFGGRFRLEQKLGEGTFGTVWLALDEHTQNKVAIKVLREELANKPMVLERFLREAKVLEALDHPNIARAITSGNDGWYRFLAMELAEGRTLYEEIHDLAKSTRHCPIEEVRAVVSQVASGLEAAHARSIVHRDLKPSNVMVSRGERGPTVKILDFGIAKIALPESDQTTIGRRLGTLTYMSPEQLMGEIVDQRTDIYALGVLLFEMLTSRRPFLIGQDGFPISLAVTSVPMVDQNSPYAVTHRIAVEPRPLPSRFRSEVGPELDAVVLRALHREKEERYSSALEMMEALDRALEPPAPAAHTAVLPRPEATSAVLVSTPKRWPTGAALLAGIVAITAIVTDRMLSPTPVEVVAIDGNTEAPAPAPAPSVRPRELEREPPPPEPATLPPPAEPPARPPVEPRSKHPTPKPPPRPPVESDPAAPLRAMLAADPSNPSAVTRVARLLEEKAEALPDHDARVDLKRCATMSAMRADAKELEICLQRFQKLGQASR